MTQRQEKKAMFVEAMNSKVCLIMRNMSGVFWSCQNRGW